MNKERKQLLEKIVEFVEAEIFYEQEILRSPNQDSKEFWENALKELEEKKIKFFKNQK